MKARVKRSIATHVIITIVGVVTLVLSIVGAFGYKAYSRQQWTELHDKFNLGADELAAGIALPVWNFDNNQIEKILESVMKDKNNYALSVNTGSKEFSLMRNRQWEIVTGKPDVIPDDVLVTKRYIVFKDQDIGELQLYLSSRFLGSQLKRTKYMMIGVVLLVDGVLILSLYALIWLRVLKPLRLIEGYATAVSSDEHRDTKMIGEPLAGEFGQLHDSLEKMVGLLESRLEDVKDSNERFWKLVSGFPIALAVYARDSNEIITSNKKFIDVFGYDLDELRNIDDWFRKAYPDEAYREKVIAQWAGDVDDALRQDNVIAMRDYRVTTRSGEERIVEISGVIAGAYVMGVLNDVTDRRRADAVLKSYQDELEKTVRERTEELVVARDQAEAANLAKSVFLANMSHELRTPLNSVIGFSRIMANDEDISPRLQKNLGIINRAGTHLLTLINDILELSKIDAGKVELNEEPVNLIQLIDEVTEMLRPRAEQAEVDLVKEVNDVPVAVRADAAKIRQILINLVSNAIKFTREGRVTLQASATRQGDYSRIEFQVSDTGIGISQEDQEKIFDPFVQIDHNGERTGTGLGLAISRQYAGMMGGAIEVDSSVGSGSSFRCILELPICSEQLVKGVSHEGHQLRSSVSYQGCRVLVADDIAEMRMLLRELLEPSGLEVIEAGNGQEAFEKIIKYQPQLVLMDWRMPVMDGLCLTRTVRSHTEIVQPRIIMLSANAFKEDSQQALVAGVDDFMSKPIDMEVLQRMIWNHIGGHHYAADLKNTAKNTLDTVSADDLALLSEDVIRVFTDALYELNPVKISDALEEIRRESPLMADRLSRYVEEIEYKKLWKIFGINNGDKKSSP